MASKLAVKARTAVINQARLNLLADLKGTRMKPKGVLGIDDTLLTHFGHHFAGIACLFDHTSGTYEWAHNLVTLHLCHCQSRVGSYT